MTSSPEPHVSSHRLWQCFTSLPVHHLVFKASKPVRCFLIKVSSGRVSKSSWCAHLFFLVANQLSSYSVHTSESLVHLIPPQTSSFPHSPICYDNWPVCHQKFWWAQKDHPAITSWIFSSALWDHLTCYTLKGLLWSTLVFLAYSAWIFSHRITLKSRVFLLFM